jgi:hypothetical protein
MGMVKETSFLLVDADGKQVTIIQWVNEELFQPLNDGPLTRVRNGPRRLTLVDGTSVHKVDNDTFKIGNTDQVLRKV